jgi:hypothetical protein
MGLQDVPSSAVDAIGKRESLGHRNMEDCFGVGHNSKEWFKVFIWVQVLVLPHLSGCLSSQSLSLPSAKWDNNSYISGVLRELNELRLMVSNLVSLLHILNFSMSETSDISVLFK